MVQTSTQVRMRKFRKGTFTLFHFCPSSSPCLPDSRSQLPPSPRSPPPTTAPVDLRLPPQPRRSPPPTAAPSISTAPHCRPPDLVLSLTHQSTVDRSSPAVQKLQPPMVQPPIAASRPVL
ncbi:hypothetical protein R6Q59_005183 [Mikania micrantha]